MNGERLLTMILHKLFQLGRSATLTVKPEIERAKLAIREILEDTPHDVYDEYNETVYESCIWELSEERKTGVARGSRRIGSANMLLANSTVMEYFNLHDQDLTEDDMSEVALQIFKSIVELLEEDRVIRQAPESIRETFTVIEGDYDRRHSNAN